MTAVSIFVIFVVYFLRTIATLINGIFKPSVVRKHEVIFYRGKKGQSDIFSL